MAILKIAYRNLSRQKRRSFLLAGAIAFGILIISMVNGLVGGILKNTENNFSAMLSAHIMVINVEFDKKRMVMQMDNPDALRVAIERLAKTYPVLYYQERTSVFNGATLMNQNDSTWLQIDGVDWKNDKFLAENLTIQEGSLKDMAGNDGIVIGQNTAKKLNIKVGEPLIIQTETIHGQQNVIEAPVRAIFQEDNLSAGTVYMDREVVNQLMDMPQGSFNWYGIFLKHFGDQDRATLALNKIIADQGYKIYPREKTVGKNFNSLFSDIRKDKDKSSRIVVVNLNDQLTSLVGVFETIKIVSLLVLVILLAVIMVGMNNTYRIIVWERNREIGTMRALGMQRPIVSRIFLLEALFLSLFGVLAGVVVATGLLSLLSLFTFEKAADFAIFLSKNHLTWAYDWGQLVFAALLVAGLSLLAAFSPARKAGKVDPAVALRTTA